MKKIFFVVAMITIIAASFLGCSKASEDMLAPKNVMDSCDTANMRYSIDIVAILSTNCSSCHGNGNEMGGISLDSYNDVKAVATAGLLVNVITHAPGYPPMPENSTQLSSCDINKIISWINAGTPNN